MLKVKTFVILIIIYVIAFISIKVDLNLFYPYYLLKDLVYFKVEAEEIILSDEVYEGINLELKAELAELKKINDISSTLVEFDSVKAVVVERNRMYWFNTITINKGKSSGIKEEMAVITGDGLIGRVSKVGNNTSEVKLITTNDVNNKISVMIKTLDDTIYGIMSSYDSDTNTLQVTSTNKKFDNLENSLVYTSGMGGVYPSGILIGKVDSVQNDKYEVSKIINVKPSSQIDNFRFVNILIRK